MVGTSWTPGEAPVVGIVDERIAASTENQRNAGADPIDRQEIADNRFESAEGHGDASTARIISAIESTCKDRDATVRTGSLEDVVASEAAMVVTIGQHALLDVVRAGVDVPVLSVSVDRENGSINGIGSVAADAVETAVSNVLAGGARTQRHPILGVDTPAGNTERSLFDVLLVTEEPARISEYELACNDRSVAQFRADGVLVATPAGSHGYAHDAGGPIVSAAVPAILAVPIAPFVMRRRRWVLPQDAVSISVERDDGAVAVVVDGRIVERITSQSSISIGVCDSIQILSVSTAGEASVE